MARFFVVAALLFIAVSQLVQASDELPQRGLKAAPAEEERSQPPEEERSQPPEEERSQPPEMEKAAPEMEAANATLENCYFCDEDA